MTAPRRRSPTCTTNTGSTRLLTNSTGATVGTFVYDAYGNLTTKTETANTPLRWNGQCQDADTGLYSRFQWSQVL
jgi:YD repeat-containing protein